MDFRFFVHEPQVEPQVVFSYQFFLSSCTADGVLLKAAPLFAPTRPRDVFGLLHHVGQPKTLKQMEAGIVKVERRDPRPLPESENIPPLSAAHLTRAKPAKAASALASGAGA